MIAKVYIVSQWNKPQEPRGSEDFRAVLGVAFARHDEQALQAARAALPAGYGEDDYWKAPDVEECGEIDVNVPPLPVFMRAD